MFSKVFSELENEKTEKLKLWNTECLIKNTILTRRVIIVHLNSTKCFEPLWLHRMIQSLLLLFQRIQHFLIRYIINVKQFTEKQKFKYLWLLSSLGKGGRAGHITLSYRKQNGQTTLKSCGGTGAQPAKNGKGGKGEKCYGIKGKVSIKSHCSKTLGHLLNFTSAFYRSKT